MSHEHHTRPWCSIIHFATLTESSSNASSRVLYTTVMYTTFNFWLIMTYISESFLFQCWCFFFVFVFANVLAFSFHSRPKFTGIHWKWISLPVDDNWQILFWVSRTITDFAWSCHMAWMNAFEWIKMSTSCFVTLSSLRCCKALCTALNSPVKLEDISWLLLDD